jgi:hypothetical protein
MLIFTSQGPYIGPEIGHQFLDGAERIDSLNTLQVPMISLAALVVATNFANTGTTIEQ